MLAEDQTEYKTLCAASVTFSDGAQAMVTRWRLTDEERARVAAGEDLFVTMLTFGKPLQPILPEIGRPEWASGTGEA